MEKEYDPLDTQAREKNLLEKSEKQALQASKEVDDVRWLMSEERGRRLMWGLLTTAGVFRTSYTGDNGTFFREGERNVGLRYLALIHAHCPDAYNAMVMEQNKK